MLYKCKSSEYDNKYVEDRLFSSFDDAEDLCNELYNKCGSILEELNTVYNITNENDYRIKQLKYAQSLLTSLKETIIDTKKSTRTMYNEYDISMKSIFDCAVTERQLDLSCKYDHDVIIPTESDFDHEIYRMYKFIMRYLKYKNLRNDAKNLFKYYKDLWESSFSSLKYYLYRLKNIALAAHLGRDIYDKIDAKSY